jgi:DNA polymerase-3 subunit alpha
VQFLAPEDFEAHEARVCIAEGETLTNPRRVKRFTREQYFKTQAQMEALFADIPSALANSVEIARRCNLSLVLGKPQLPDFPTPLLDDGAPMPMADYFRVASHEGLVQRLEQLFPDVAERERERPRYVERLEFEISDDPEDGLPRLLPDRGRLHQLGQEQRLPGRPGPRLGRRLAGRLRAEDHRPRPAALQPAVRAAS